MRLLRLNRAGRAVTILGDAQDVVAWLKAISWAVDHNALIVSLPHLNDLDRGQGQGMRRVNHTQLLGLAGSLLVAQVANRLSYALGGY